jgi:hypothetical protein
LGGDEFVMKLPPPVFKPRQRLTLAQLAEHHCESHRVTIVSLRSPLRHRYLTAVRVAIARQVILPHFPGHLDMRFNSTIEVLDEEQGSQAE